MAQATSIEWTDMSWNPTHGCSRVSTGCGHCYAETLSLRYGQTTKPWTARNAAENVLLKAHKLREPLSKAKAWRGLGAAAAVAGKTDGKLVFVNSMSDLFHEQIPDEYIFDVFVTMTAAKRHTFQVLTKRPERMRDMLAWDEFWPQVRIAADDLIESRLTEAEQYWFETSPNAPLGHLDDVAEPPGHIWLGVSIENRKWVGRAGILRETPAAVRFISAEPLLGPLVPDGAIAGGDDGLTDLAYRRWADAYRGEALDLTGVDWLILGGESGPKHRPLDVQWMRDLRGAACDGRVTCAHCIGDCYIHGTPASGPPIPCPRCGGRGWQGTAVFVKQLGGPRPGTALEDLPEDLRIREFPR